MMQRTLLFDIPFEPGIGKRVGWTLKLRLNPYDPAIVMVGLYWGDKSEPTHITTCIATELQAAFAELVAEGQK